MAVGSRSGCGRVVAVGCAVPSGQAVRAGSSGQRNAGHLST